MQEQLDIFHMEEIWICAIAIRTLSIKRKSAYLQAGAGIVYDSDPETEFEEIQNKLMVLKEALR